jgi:hypothetical protein
MEMITMITKKSGLLFILIFLFFCPTIVLAEIKIGIDMQNSFTLEEKPYYEYNILSDEEINVTIIPYISCPSFPIAPLMEKRIQLTKDQPYRDAYYSIKIDDSIEPQTCTAYVEIISPIQKRVEKNFTIKTNPSFDFEILMDKKVFVLNENVNMDYASEVSGPSIVAKLTYPDKTNREITLPYSFTAEQIGTYEVNAEASKEGYKTITKGEQFGVIEKEPEIRSASECDGDGICDYGENQKNCPQDCQGINVDNQNLILIAVSFVAAVILICAVFLFKKKK